MRLTMWYAGTFTVILLLLGAGLYLTVRRQLSKQLDESLSAATSELARVAGSRKLAKEKGDSALMDAVDELRIPERTLYLLDSAGRPLVPTIADQWIVTSAVKAATTGQASAEYDASDDRTLRLEARRFRTTNGRSLVAAAIADQYELEDRYTDLIGAFAGAALGALLLVAVGGWILAQKSIAPIEANVANMRRFMADAAHELKTPIAVLRAKADVALQRPRDTEAYTSALKTVEHESRRLGAIVDHLLVLARADAGERRLTKQSLYLDDVASDCFGSVKAMADRKGVNLSLSALEEAPVRADPALARELGLILLDNGIKFTPRGGTVTMTVSMDGGHPTLVVADTGEGIDTEELPRVFDRFYRAPRTSSGRDGAGLGLAIAKWIAHEHGASIALASQPGAGTTVTVRFPSIA